MNRREFIAFAAVVAGLLLSAFLSSSVNAQQPPQDGCVGVPKIQYDSAKKQYLLRNRFGMYVRTGGIFRRHYWYCRY